MQKRLPTLLVIILLLLPVSVGARSLVNVSLGFGATYSPQEDQAFDLGLQDPDNWLIGGELSARLAFVQANAMVLPIECGTSSGVLMLGMGSLSLPVIGSLVSLEVGGGVGVTYVPSNADSSRSYYELADETQADASQMSFTDAVRESPMYLQVGLGSELGPIGVKIRYLMESQATLGSVMKDNAWWSAFALKKQSLSLALALKMF